MPIYAYRCDSCGVRKDVLQKISDAPLAQCPECGADSFRKELTAPAFQLKGSGWYVTDFRDQGKNKAGAPDKSGDADKAGAAAESAGAASAAAASAAAASAGAASDSGSAGKAGTSDAGSVPASTGPAAGAVASPAP